MTDTIMNILQWAIPSGGIGAAIAWIANRKVKAAEQAKKIHDTYKSMYEDISRELLDNQKKLDESAKENARAIEELNRENQRTRNALNRLSRAIEAIQLCPYRGNCPVSGELQNGEEGTDRAEDADAGRAKKRQPRKPKPDKRDPDGAKPAERDHMDEDLGDATPGQRWVHPHGTRTEGTAHDSQGRAIPTEGRFG